MVVEKSLTKNFHQKGDGRRTDGRTEGMDGQMQTSISPLFQSGGIKSGQEWTLPAQLGQLKTGQDGKGLLRKYLWCPDDLPRLWDRIE